MNAICVVININYIDSHHRRQQSDTLLTMDNLKSTVNFPTRNVNSSSTVIDNIFIDLSRNFSINPIINGLSDQNAELLTLENITALIQEHTSCYVGNINSFTPYEF